MFSEKSNAVQRPRATGRNMAPKIEVIDEDSERSADSDEFNVAQVLKKDDCELHRAETISDVPAPKFTNEKDKNWWY
jgi:hypothetical protein